MMLVLLSTSFEVLEVVGTGTPISLHPCITTTITYLESCQLRFTTLQPNLKFKFTIFR